MPKVDIGGTIILLIMFSVWPLMPTVLIIWGLVNADSAQKLIDSLTETTTGTILQSGTFTGGELDEQDDDSRYLALSIWFEYEVDGTKYEGGRFAPGILFPPRSATQDWTRYQQSMLSENLIRHGMTLTIHRRPISSKAASGTMRER